MNEQQQGAPPGGVAGQQVQVFYWMGDGKTHPDGRIHYTHFCLNNQQYGLGDCVYLYPEDEQTPHYVGRIKAAFWDYPSGHADPHKIEIKWYERRVNLEPLTKGIEESEREVFELGDTDINPIGCISGKCYVLRAQNYEDALMAISGVTNDWFFCRGFFMQDTSSFRSYTQEEMAHNEGLPVGVNLPGVPPLDVAAPLDIAAWDPGIIDFGIGGKGMPRGLDAFAGLGGGSRRADAAPLLPAGRGVGVGADADLGPGLMMGIGGGVGAASAQYEEEEEEEEEGGEGDRPSAGRGPSAAAWAAPIAGNSSGGNGASRQQFDIKQGAAATATAPAQQRKPAAGMMCVECGATQTPQWREGPTGPKTLCNACGVRYGREKQKGVKKSSRGSSASKGGRGSGGSSRPTPKKASNQDYYDEDEDEEAYDGGARSGSKGDSGGRPKRQAAKRAAAFARSLGNEDENDEGLGELNGDEDEDLDFQGKRGKYME